VQVLPAESGRSLSRRETLRSLCDLPAIRIAHARHVGYVKGGLKGCQHPDVKVTAPTSNAITGVSEDSCLLGYTTAG